MSQLTKLIYILLTFCFFIVLGFGDDEVIGKYETPPSYLKTLINPDKTAISTLNSPSSRIMSSGSEIPIIVSKHTKNSKAEYNKKENITIKIRILNCDKRNKIEIACLKEEIPEGFRVISPVVNSDNGPKYYTKDGIHLLEWNFDRVIPNFNRAIYDLCYIEYTIQGDIGGIHNLASTIFSASVLDRKGEIHEIVSTSEDLTLTIKDTPPELFKYPQENPIYVRHNKPISVTAGFIDAENDTINCKIIFNNTQTEIEPSSSSPENSTTLFTWDLSRFTNHDRVFYLKASDKELSKYFGPFELKTYMIIDYERYLFSEEILGIVSFFFRNMLQLILAIITLFTLYNYSKVVAKVKLLINPVHREAMKKYNRALEAEEWNKKGLELCRFHKFNEAILAFNNALEIDPNLPDILNNKGKTLFNKKAYKEAIECFNKAIEIDTNLVESLYFKGKAMMMLDSDSAAAKESIDEAIKLGYKP
jgi:hypothetical protein